MTGPVSRRAFLGTATAAATLSRFCQTADADVTAQPAAGGGLRTVDAAARHPIVYPGPAVNFLEGAILGNGAMGVVVTTLPDAVMLYFGHNAVWDQRMAALDVKRLGTFQEALARIKAIPETVGNLTDDPWFRNYQEWGRASYLKPYPRPLACGAVALGFDRRNAEVLGHRLFIEKGLCQVDFLVNGERKVLEMFVDMSIDRLWGRMVDEAGRPTRAPFSYVALLPDHSIPAEFPRYTHEVLEQSGTLAYRQILPYEEIAAASGERLDPSTARVDRTSSSAARQTGAASSGHYSPHPKDRAFSLSAHVNAQIDRKGRLPRGITIGARLADVFPFLLDIQLQQGLASSVTIDARQHVAPTLQGHQAAATRSAGEWRTYWEQSGVFLEDPLLEQTWYWNMYFLRCALKPGTVAPGAYAICPYPNRQALAWHGDYHMDYNCQQAFWSTFSSNHPELHLPYVDMVHALLPSARQWARDYYEMRGAYFPVSAYPVDMRSYPYAPPVFNWMVSVSPWVVQSLWWHYVYTHDVRFLEERAFEPIKSVALFLVDYIKRPDVYDRPWGDQHYHIFPTFPPELYRLQPGLKNNADPLPDLTLSRFVFLAYLRACEVLQLEAVEAGSIKDVNDVMSRLPKYPTAESSRGTVFVSIRGEDPETVYNVPVSLMSVFPGEHHGLHSPPEEYSIAANTYRNQQNEGGNDLVFLNLQAARLGLLDLEKFKRQIRYCLMPNGTCTDKNLQIGGRFGFGRSYDWMADYGIWFENFALPAVINECLLQGYQGELRFFPNWPVTAAAEFRALRTAGAFLVSAQFRSGAVQWIEIVSEAGERLTIVSPWTTGAVCTRNREQLTFTAPRFSVETRPGDRIRLTSLTHQGQR